jgi:threonine aldolase
MTDDRTEEIDLRSDNGAPVTPEIMAALERANRGSAASYGDDEITGRLTGAFRELFETDLVVFPVVSGTAANALSISQITPAYGAVFCHEHAHLNTDECGAPEFFSGGAKLVPVPGQHAKLDPEALALRIQSNAEVGVHQSESSALSVSQSTELGSVYQPEELRRLSGIARDSSLRLHMDGARLGNAIDRLGCTPAEATWRTGVDVLSFGATKNGALAAEAIVVFDRDLTEGLDRRRKRAGHLISKMRFVSAQLEAYIADGLWLRLAAQANRAADSLAAGMQQIPGVALAHPAEANEIFLRLPTGLAEGLGKSGILFFPWPGERDVYRFVTSYCTSNEDVVRVLERAARIQRENG